MTPKVYGYNKDTGEFVGESLADENPLEVGQYLVPAQAVLVSPPETGENEVAVWVGDAWVVTKDFRGNVYDKGTGDMSEYKNLGELPKSLTKHSKPVGPYTWSDEGDCWVIDVELQNKQVQLKINEEARAYLSSTDWYGRRQEETGKPIPQEILDERVAARARVVDLV